MLPMTVLRRFDCVLAPTKGKVLAEFEKRKGGKLNDDALDRLLSKASGQRFHNHSPLDFDKLKADADNIDEHLVSYIKGFSANVQRIFEFFEFENEIEKMRESNILYLVVSKFSDVDLHPNSVPNTQMGLIFENLIRHFRYLFINVSKRSGGRLHEPLQSEIPLEKPQFFQRLIRTHVDELGYSVPEFLRLLFITDETPFRNQYLGENRLRLI